MNGEKFQLLRYGENEINIKLYRIPNRNRRHRTSKEQCEKSYLQRTQQSNRCNKSNKRNQYNIRGPRLFHTVPAAIRNTVICTVENFKKNLDKYLESEPDQPGCDGYVGLEADCEEEHQGGLV